jgi:hypothetical protein
MGSIFGEVGILDKENKPRFEKEYTEDVFLTPPLWEKSLG